MKNSYKIYHQKFLYIYFIFLSLIIFFFSTVKLEAKAFDINNIDISRPFEINFNKNEVIEEGFKEAFFKLISLIVKSTDQKKINQIKLNEIKGMVESFTIKEEKFIDEIYYLTLNVSFNKKRIFNLLESKNIFPSLLIKKKIFFIPIIVDENKDEILMFSENYLFNIWNSNIKKYHLLEYVLPEEDLEDFNLIKQNLKNLENYDFNEIIKKYNLEDYIITIVFKNDNEISVLNKINFNKKKDFKNLKYKNLDINNDIEIKEFTENLKTIFENHWKSKNEINTSVKLSLTISANNNDYMKISQFEKTLSNTDLIYDFYIFKFNNRKNIYKIIFNGTPDYFLKIMNKKNHHFNTLNQVWSLE